MDQSTVKDEQLGTEAEIPGAEMRGDYPEKSCGAQTRIMTSDATLIHPLQKMG